MFIYYLIALLSLLLYLYGFFPIPPRPLHNPLPNDITAAQPPYVKTVIVVIDALRVDFISTNNTPFLSKTAQKGGCFIQLKVESPTVTLPRVKALTTGSVPQFIDIIVNLANPTAVDDSIVHRAKARQKKIVFYGDDIWLKLFGMMFERSEGTSSFFVRDYTEVDDNVTRNVNQEIYKTDWDIMILHYLGLDHIGHVYGPRSPLIFTKLQEMDSIIEKMHKTLNESTVFLITGDHGMRDSGGHGGSSPPETKVPLIVLNMPCKNDSFEQIDIPANLAVLLGLDIPTTSIGLLRDSLISHLPPPLYMGALKYNLQFLKNKLDMCQEMELGDKYLELFLNGDNTMRDKASEVYHNCARRISENLLKSAVRQNLGSLAVATLAAFFVLIKLTQRTVMGMLQFRWDLLIVVALLILQFFTREATITSLSLVWLLFVNGANLAGFGAKQLKCLDVTFLTFLTFIHPFIFFSSSFVEEENVFWYFLMNTFILLKIFTQTGNRKWWLILLVCLRFVMSLNQVGDKWSKETDLSDWLMLPRNLLFLKIFFIVALIFVFGCLLSFKPSLVSSFFGILILFAIYLFRMIKDSDIFIGQLIWLLIGVKFVVNVFKREGFLSTWVLIITFLIKPNNTILIPICMLGSKVFQRSLNSKDIMLSHWWLGNILFFAQGHDNSLASVDISSGYLGLSEYNPIYVICQVLSHTYALPVLSHLLLFQIKSFEVLPMFILLRLHILLIVFITTFIHRHHLFVWSVFAPKMFVEASHFAVLVIEVCLYYLFREIKHILKI